MPNNLGKIIREAREEKKMSRECLARLSDISTTQIANMEKGTTKKPRTNTIVALCKVLELNHQELLERIGEKEEELQGGGGYFAEKLKKVRRKRGLSKRQCAKLIGISDMQLSNLEKGKVEKPQVATIKLLSEFLGLDYNMVLQEFGYNDEIAEEESDLPSVILGRKIRKERIAKGMGQTKLAEMIDVGVDEIYRIEKGIVQNPRVEILEAIEICLGIELPE